MIRTKGEAGTGNVVEAVRHMSTVMQQLSHTVSAKDEELTSFAKEWGCPLELLREVKFSGGLPVVNFAAGGIATRPIRPHDAAGADGVFVGRDLQVGNPQWLPGPLLSHCKPR
jgi:pyridoxal 5'-phosphate synthase pdxS subunit